MGRLFVLSGDTIVNVVVISDDPWTAPEGCTTMPVPDDCPAGIGWRWDGQQFIAPPAPEPEPEPDA